MNLLEIPLVFICGFTFPVEILPEWMQCISNMLAPTWAVRLLRMSINAVNTDIYVQYFKKLVVELIIMILLTIGLYYRINKRIRVYATLEVS